MSVGPGIDEGVCSDDELYNPCKLPGDVWEPDPKTIVELYEKLDKEGVLALEWKSPGKLPVPEMTTPQKQVDVVQETPEEEAKLRGKQDMLSMFDADDFSHQSPNIGSLMKTPSRTPKSTPKAKASFDKIFNKVSLQSTGEDKSSTSKSQ
ncbi:uncharacterized protein [Watersipora subatra]|uniref:uncharacterized protein n=1 Tax=Watersipora subatra TaxID=2589382 RepID=UPI00355C7491